MVPLIHAFTPSSSKAKVLLSSRLARATLIRYVLVGVTIELERAFCMASMRFSPQYYPSHHKSTLIILGLIPEEENQGM